MKVKFKKIHPEVQLPLYSHEGDAGANLFSLEDKILQSGERYTFNLGFATEFDRKYLAFICDRSGLAAKEGIICLGGLIDANYRGEWGAIILNSSAKAYEIKKGDKIAQVLFQQVEIAQFEEAMELDQSTRATGGFGSTGR